MRVYLLSLIIGKWMVRVFGVFAVGFAFFLLLHLPFLIYERWLLPAILDNYEGWQGYEVINRTHCSYAT